MAELRIRPNGHRGMVIETDEYAIKFIWERYSTPVNWRQIIDILKDAPSSISFMNGLEYSGKIFITTVLTDREFHRRLEDDFSRAGLI